MVCLFVWWCLMPLSTIFQLYHGGQFYWWRKPEDLEKTINLSHELTTSVVIDIDCIGSCKSNNHMITTTTAPNTIWHHYEYEQVIPSNNLHYLTYHITFKSLIVYNNPIKRSRAWKVSTSPFGNKNTIQGQLKSCNGYRLIQDDDH